METHNLSFGDADGEAHANAEAMHAVNQNPPSPRGVREENNVIGTAQERYTAARAQHQARLRCHGAHVLMQAIKENAKKRGLSGQP